MNSFNTKISLIKELKFSWDLIQNYEITAPVNCKGNNRLIQNGSLITYILQATII